jgi:hypothetical protein
MRLSSSFPVFLAVVALAVPVCAQQKAVAASKTLRIGNMPKLSKQHLLVKTPAVSVRSDIRTSSTKPGEWAFFSFEYETAPEWIDDLAVTYYVMSQGIDLEGNPEYNLFQATVHYGDIAKGKHQAAVVLPPVAITRYGMPVAFAVEVSDDGNEPVAKSSDGKAPDGWWTNEKFTERMVPRDGYLVDRSKTLFQFVNPDDYEAVR